MTPNRICFISRNYYNLTSAGNKAKTDYEDILSSMGAKQLGFSRKIGGNKIFAFFYNLLGTLTACIQIKKDDILVLQYPVKKYYSFICNIAHLKGSKTISLIHDLGSFRRKKLTIRQEIKRLSHTDYVIASNEAMKDWLLQQGFCKPVGTLGFHDYISPTSHGIHLHQDGVWDIIYAGSLNLRKNEFILKMKEIDKSFKFHLYGNMTDYDALAKDKSIIWHGFTPAESFIANVKGDFGLVWDGDSLDECHGDFGGYLKYNTPHKASFYLRAGLPIIVWRESAIAPLVEKEGIGLVINSLKDLPSLLQQLPLASYNTMQTRAHQLSIAINNGENLKRAIHDARIQSDI